MATTRGIRNFNPANIRRSSDAWQGLAPQQTDRAFFQFIAMPYGVRALIKTLYTYVHKYSLRTNSAIINRFCPVGDANNNPTAYVRTVDALMACKYTNVTYTEEDFYTGSRKLYLLCYAICLIESRYTLSEVVFKSALRMCEFYRGV